MERVLKIAAGLAGLAAVMSSLGCAAARHPDASPVNVPALDESAVKASGCVSVYLIGSRGSGQEAAGADAYHGLGPEVYQFSARFAADLKPAGQSYAYLADPYPAVAISPGGANADEWMWNLAGQITRLPVGAYDSSVAAGVADVLASTRYLIATCPDTRILLAGYSQGAAVSGDAYQQLTAAERAHVLGVFLLADPHRNASDRAADAGSASDGRARAGARPVFPVTSPEQVRSYCQAGDPVCDGPFQISGWHLTVNDDPAKHLDYVTAKTACATYPEQAADYFASLAGAKLPEAGPVAALTPVPDPVAGLPVWISAGASCGDSALATMTAHVGAAGPSAGLPGAPILLTVHARPGSATLTWSPPAAGPPAEGYLISTVSGDPLGETGPGEPRSITIGGANLPMRVIVQSVNGAGDGGMSPPVELSLPRALAQARSARLGATTGLSSIS